MGTNSSEASQETRPRALHDPKRSIRYKLTLELRRLERNGRGETTYASAICQALDVLPSITSDAVLKLLERELEKEDKSQREQRYASVLSSVFSRLDEHEPSCSKLFAYYLERLENEGRGNEPFANALRRALKSYGARVSTPFLYSMDTDEFET